MDAETFLTEHLADIHRATAFVSRRHDLRGADAEDFDSRVMLKIIENDYAVIRKFESRCSFQSYIVVVANRMLLDERNHELGKWRPSAEARRLGETAVLLETLLRRDRQTLDQAMQTIQSQGIPVTRAELDELSSRLPERRHRPRQVSLDEADSCQVAISGATVAADAEAGERLALAGRIATILRSAIRRLPQRDRVIIRMRFEADMTVAEIARALQIPQKPVYRLLAAHLTKLRRIFTRAGIHARDVEAIVGIEGTPLDGGFTHSTDQQTIPSVGKE